MQKVQTELIDIIIELMPGKQDAIINESTDIVRDLEFDSIALVELLNEIEKKGIYIIRVTLHVGLGTFRPVNVEDVTKHEMHTETYMISSESAKKLNEVRKNGGKIYLSDEINYRNYQGCEEGQAFRMEKYQGM